MKRKTKPPALNRAEWFFGQYRFDKGKPDERRADECLACCYYEYARSCPLMIERIRDAEDVAEQYAFAHPAPQYSFAFTNKFPGTPWLALPQKERNYIVGLFKAEAAKQELIYAREPSEWSDTDPWKPEFKEFGPYLLEFGASALVTFDISWARGNDDLETAFRKFLHKYRPKGSGPKRGRVKNPLDRLNALGAYRMIKHCELTQGLATPRAAFDQMCRQLAWSRQEVDKPYKAPGPLGTAARRARHHLLDLFLVAEARPLKRTADEFDPICLPCIFRNDSRAGLLN